MPQCQGRGGGVCVCMYVCVCIHVRIEGQPRAGEGIRQFWSESELILHLNSVAPSKSSPPLTLGFFSLVLSRVMGVAYSFFYS